MSALPVPQQPPSVAAPPDPIALTAAKLMQHATEAFARGGLTKFTMKDATDVLELAVNHQIGEQPRRFDPTVDAARASATVADLTAMVNRLPVQRGRDDESERFQQFSTPPDYAFLVAWVANLGRGDVVLEPSAGVGGLAVFAANAGVADVICNEISERRVVLLRALPKAGRRVFAENAEQIHNILDESISPTVVLMNPPFSAAGTRMAGKRVRNVACLHVDQALLRLRDGGRLVAVLGESTGEADWWEELSERYCVRAIVHVPGAVYRKYGTTYGTKIVVIDKLPPDGEPAMTALAEDLQDALRLLTDVRQGRDVTRLAPAPLATTRAAEADAGLLPGFGALFGKPSANDPKPKTATGAVLVAALSEVQNMQSAAYKAEPLKLAADQSARAVIDTRPLTDSIYDPYHPQRLKVHGAQPHPTPLVESAAMASVLPPVPNHSPALPLDLITEGTLSEAQLEAIVYAGQAHRRHLPVTVARDPMSGETRQVAYRKGFFIGDGTGVGKGRELCGIILDSFARGARKAIWVSKNNRLIKDAIRDWVDLGGRASDVINFAKIGSGEAIPAEQGGILFLTYGLLKSVPKVKQAGGAAAAAAGAGQDKPKTRLQRVVEWAADQPDLVIGFDEAHQMKSAIEVKKKRGYSKVSDTALAGQDLQAALPDAKVVFLSATGATEVANLAYAAERLGLCGTGTPFANKNDFVKQIDSGGVAAMELVARDLKQRGLYCARGLSFEGVEYDRLLHVLTPEQRLIYDRLCDAWQLVYSQMDKALELIAMTNSGKVDGKTKGAARGAFRGAQLRFFNTVLVSMQMPSVIAEVERDLKAGNCAVLQLVNTNEASQERAIDALGPDDDLSDIDMTPRDQLLEMIRHCFPVQQMEEYLDGEKIRMRPCYDSQGNPVINREAAAMRQELLDDLEMIRCPDGPLEMLLNHFGYQNVAEVTGRTRRVVRTMVDGVEKTVLQNRGPMVSMAEAADFQDGKRLVLVFSDAGGTGQSYHASETARNQRRRIHYLVQAGWVADAAVQGFGRTHRSNQVVPPLYKLVSTDIKGQKRFISTIARRLDQLGALTKGQRQAAGSGSLFKLTDNLESDHARAALRILYRDLYDGRVQGLTLREFERMTALELSDEQKGGLREDLPPVTTFLNRLLALQIDKQNALFEQYSERIEAKVQHAIDTGTLDVGVETIRTDSCSKVSERVVYTDPESGAETKMVELTLRYRNEPLAFDDVLAGGEATGNRSILFWRQNKISKRVYAFTGCGERQVASGDVIPMYYQVAPLGRHPVPCREIDDKDHWQDVTADEARPLWDAVLATIPEYAEDTLHLITGAILPIWDRLVGNPKVKRLATDAGERLLGRVVDAADVDATLTRLGVAGGTAKTWTADEVRRLLDAGRHYFELANGWKLKRRRLNGQYRYEVEGPEFFNKVDLSLNGVTFERIDYRGRWLVNGVGEGAVEALTKVVARWPVAKPVRREDEADAA